MKPRLPVDNGVQKVHVSDLMLDPENPRLPESADSWSIGQLVTYFRTDYAIDEIIESMLRNGFFEQEPLIILAEPDPVRNQYVVVEGSRRLSSLMYIHGAVDEDYFDEPPSESQIARLEWIPCVVVESREEVRTYLGFRHIGGIKDWSPEAKARFVALEVDRLAESGEENPFRVTGKAYGSNAQGIRNAYIALKILRHAKDEYGISIDFVQHNRFGVWQRCLNSGPVRDYIGFGKPRTFSEIQQALSELDETQLKEVLSDLTPKGPQAKALLSDSRQVTEYGKVIINDRARQVLREYGDLDAAVQVVREEDLPGRIEKLAITVRTLVDEVIDAPYSNELMDSVSKLARETRKLRTEMDSKESEST